MRGRRWSTNRSTYGYRDPKPDAVKAPKSSAEGAGIDAPQAPRAGTYGGFKPYLKIWGTS